MIPVKPVIEADLLIVGGGIGGLMAGGILFRHYQCHKSK